MSGGFHQQRSGGYRAETHTRLGADAVTVQHQIDPGPHDRDIHFRARNEAKVGISAVRGLCWQHEIDDKFARREAGLAGRRDNRSDRHLAAPAWACDGAGRPRRNQRRHTVGGRRGVTQIAAEARPALNLRGADQAQRFHHPRPHLHNIGVFANLGTGGGGANAKAAALGADCFQFRDAFEIDDALPLQATAAQLHQQIRAAGQHPRMRVFLQQRDGLIDRGRVLKSQQGLPPGNAYVELAP